ncbi:MULTISPECIES: NAD(P)/FAD-dependent oxidoreductase [Chromobacterium]|uniref:FAD-dependent oxidoreductase n=2 Tax=Chromobacterium TaxID=535 RepID=A0A1W0CY29_9NEIS|nr:MULTISPECIES: NAD(P)/FAD-dependent oxidoreductase [Chromobacterium]AXT48058.1 NAD(P)/FAD-dependent oxidoreductase [Chromobacterium rhizoryzae]OQS39568.1 FAD-dependent oxidoreductase [Chromobacterium haemolyticum]OQS39850.1 FAD-dependent oxidoreductase [Chromobacterium haemolyticum]PTU71671.1 NAD(P)/FAD-dependent oxidoreductase [Chromobacterium haemolyticum]QOD82012.1 NAD(P)/FAD-dependent oxidoreductase [Chromobacterium haemolyticum]
MLSRNSALPSIVVVGGGAGGLELATRLGRTLGAQHKARVVLVDGSPTHIWKPLLHEVATGALNTGEDEVNYFAHGYRNGYEFEFGYMQSLDTERRSIQLAEVRDAGGAQLSPPREVSYDWLVLAVGAEANDFGTPGVGEHAMFLNTPDDAEKLRHRVLELAFRCSSGLQPLAKLGIAIVGGGATGVELAAELNHTLCELHHYGARLQPERVEISVIEGADRILAAAPPSLSAYAQEQLAARNIKVLTGSRVAAVHADGVELQGGDKVAADITVWAAGVKAPGWLAGLGGLQTNRINQLQVDKWLRCQGAACVYALGDCAEAPDGDSGRNLPATAQVAHQQARWLADELSRRVAGRQGKPFVFKPQGMLVSLGKHSAVGSLAAVVGPKRDYYVEGRGAKLIYSSLYRMHQAAVHGWVLAGLLYVGDKLRRAARPSLKLH